MKILIAPDSFKDCLSALEVANYIQLGILSVLPYTEIRMLPMADGGEGTVQALVDATGGRLIFKQVNDPLMRPVNAFFGILGDGKTAIIEMATASGIQLLNVEERNPWQTSTYGTGELIIEAINCGCRNIIVGIGGSATNDGGMGMANALGVNFEDVNGLPVIPSGGNIIKVNNINTRGIDPRIAECKLQVACDVNNPLTGEQGASLIYGEQKGANNEMMDALDKNLKHWAQLIRNQLNKEVEFIAGSGAAGGMGAGFLAFTKAQLSPGFEIISEIVHLNEAVQWADLVITGEGKMDDQTKFGKTPIGVAKIAKVNHKPIIAIAGSLGEGYSKLYELGFDALFSITNRPMSISESITEAPSLLKSTAATIARVINLYSSGTLK